MTSLSLGSGLSAPPINSSTRAGRFTEIFCPAGPMLNDRYRGQSVGAGTHTRKFFDEYSAGNIGPGEWIRLEAKMTRSPGTCNTMGTASTMTGIAEAMGFTLPQVYRHVLMPMAYRIIMPPLTSEFLNIFKNSAVATTIGLIELSRQAQQLVDFTAQPYEAFIAVTLLYVMINVTVMYLMRRVEKTVQVPGFVGGK